MVLLIGAVGSYQCFSRSAKFLVSPEVATVDRILAANPDLEMVRADKAAKSILVRDRRTGKETTFSFEEIKAGKFLPEGAAGGVSHLPAWLAYPDSTLLGSTSSKGRSVTMLKTPHSPEQVLSYYDHQLAAYGFEVVLTNSYQFKEKTVGAIDSKSNENGRVAATVALARDGMTSIVIVHQEARGEK